MSQETLEILQKADGEDIEMKLAFHCAPLIAGLKISNLLMLQKDALKQVKSISERAGLSFFAVAAMDGKAAVLLFDRQRLEDYVWEEQVWRLFQGRGYKNCAIGNILAMFRLRYEGYLTQNQEFPHELGLLLGYPVEDVEGFILNDGANFLYSGYWKVYGKLSEKMALFREFEKARDFLLIRLSEGASLVEIMQKQFLS